MRLRQVALVARELAPVREDIFTLLGLRSDYDDKGVGEFGLRNSVMAMGDTFLEVVSPNREGTTAGRLLDRRGGDGGYMVLAQVDDFSVVNARLDELNLRKIWEIRRDEVLACHVHPKDIGAAIVSFDQMIPAEEWVWGGPRWKEQVASFVGNILACDIQGEDPQAMAEKWSDAFARETRLSGDQIEMLLDDGSQINFVEARDGRGDGVSAVEFAVVDGDAIRSAAAQLHLTWRDNEVALCGTRFRFRF